MRQARAIFRTQRRLGLKKSLYVYGNISSQYARAVKSVRKGDTVYLTFKLRTSVKCKLEDRHHTEATLLEPGCGRNYPFIIIIPDIGTIEVPITATCIYTPLRASGNIRRGDVIAILNTDEKAINAIYEERRRLAEEEQKLKEERKRQAEIWEASRPSREEERLLREKEEIAKKIKERQRKRELEKAVIQELIDKGEIYATQTKRPPIPRDIVDAIYQRDKGCCVYCGSTENLQIDHIIPVSKGGASTIENLQILCQKCNLQKSDKIG